MKGGALENIGMALSGYGSALSGNPMYLQNSMLLRQAQDQRRQQEQQERQQQVSDIATRSLMRGGSQMNDANKMGMLRLMAPQAFQSALAQQAIGQLFPERKSPIVAKPGEVILDPNKDYKQIAAVPTTPDPFQRTNMQKPGTNQVVMATTPEEFERYKAQGFVASGMSVPGAKSPDAPKDTFGDERNLRQEFDQKTSQFGVVRDAYSAISEFATNPSAAGDISLVYQFMKMQDPNSSVRENEYANAENAGGVPERIRNVFNKLQDGQFLTPQQRADFVKQSGRLYDTRLRSYKQEETRYRDLAKRYGFDPDKITYDRSGGLLKTDIAPPMAGDVQDGWRFKGGDPASPDSWEKVG